MKLDFQVTPANARTIAEICVRLDGLPLAIELAAARVKLFPPQALLARLDQRLQVLTSGARDAPARQQSLRNTIAWSYDLLNAEEQRLFRWLSVFVGGCTLEAVEAICALLDDRVVSVLGGVASLIDKSLLQQTEQDGEEPRLLMLETIREYGLECLSVSREKERTRQVHAEYFLALAEEAEPELDGPQQAVWLERLEREHDNLRAVMRWSLEQGEAGQGMEMALRLGGALWRFWQVHGHYSEGRIFLERVLAGSEAVIASVRAKALKAAAGLAVFQGDTDRAEALWEESPALYRELRDTANIASSLYWLAEVTSVKGNLAAARSLIGEALALCRESGDKGNIAWALNNLAVLDVIQGEYARAHALYEESLTLHRELGNMRGIANSLFRLAEVLFITQGDQASIPSLLEEGLTLFRAVGDKEGTAESLCLSGRLALSQGDVTTARSLAEECVALSREKEDWWAIARSLCLLAQVEAYQGDHAAARALYEESLAIAKKWNYKLHMASYLEGLAGVVVVQGEPAWAAQLWGAAKAVRDAMGAPLPPVERADYERSVATARIHLGEKAFTAAWVEGRMMTPEQALAAQGKAMISSPMPARTASAPPVKAPTSPAGLTAREVEVLRLVAQGLTNPRIAERLIISSHTVNAHVRSIYNKLNITSRSTLTRYAIEHKLLEK